MTNYGTRASTEKTSAGIFGVCFQDFDTAGRPWVGHGDKMKDGISELRALVDGGDVR